MARYGAIQVPPGGFQLVEDETSGGNYIIINAPTLGSNFTLTLPNVLPGSTRALTVSSSGNMGYGDLGAGGGGNVDGGFANSVYLVDQSIDGGGA